MSALFYFLIVIHIILSLFMVGVVLLQTGQSADLAGAFGGQGSQTAFGPRGATNIMTRVTAWVAVLFMFTSLGLTIVIGRTGGNEHSVLSGTKTTQSTPKK